ncbi:hypothetical protein LCGC14_3111280, partial [marine sediment metagenome]
INAFLILLSCGGKNDKNKNGVAYDAITMKLIKNKRLQEIIGEN